MLIQKYKPALYIQGESVQRKLQLLFLRSMSLDWICVMILNLDGCTKLCPLCSSILNAPTNHGMRHRLTTQQEDVSIRKIAGAPSIQKVSAQSKLF